MYFIDSNTYIYFDKTLADESADDAYCLRLYADYLADTDKGEPVSIESFARELGVSL